MFPPTKLSEKELACKLELGNTCFSFSTKDGAENIKNHIRATSEPQDGHQIAAIFFSARVFCKMTIGPLPPFFLSVSTRKHPSIKLSTQQHDASSNNSLFKNNPQKNLKEKKTGE